MTYVIIGLLLFNTFFQFGIAASLAKLIEYLTEEPRPIQPKRGDNWDGIPQAPNWDGLPKKPN